jgi:hypothetical protein
VTKTPSRARVRGAEHTHTTRPHAAWQHVHVLHTHAHTHSAGRRTTRGRPPLCRLPAHRQTTRATPARSARRPWTSIIHAATHSTARAASADRPTPAPHMLRPVYAAHINRTAPPTSCPGRSAGAGPQTAPHAARRADGRGACALGASQADLHLPCAPTWVQRAVSGVFTAGIEESERRRQLLPFRLRALATWSTCDLDCGAFRLPGPSAEHADAPRALLQGYRRSELFCERYVGRDAARARSTRVETLWESLSQAAFFRASLDARGARTQRASWASANARMAACHTRRSHDTLTILGRYTAVCLRAGAHASVRWRTRSTRKSSRQWNRR